MCTHFAHLRHNFFRPKHFFFSFFLTNLTISFKLTWCNHYYQIHGENIEKSSISFMEFVCWALVVSMQYDIWYLNIRFHIVFKWNLLDAVINTIIVWYDAQTIFFYYYYCLKGFYISSNPFVFFYCKGNDSENNRFHWRITIARQISFFENAYTIKWKFSQWISTLLIASFNLVRKWND